MLNRLFSIIYILMNKKTVTARELAERFEVSVRTIYRDIENLSMAGIPIYTKKGKNGGICLTEQFILDKLLVTREEQKQILAALASLQETGAQKDRETMLRMGDFFDAEPLNWVSIDLSDWSGRRQELFEQVKEAILSHKVLSFDYYGQYGDMSHRTVEPVQLLFKDYTWYLRAFCRTREDWRLFKLLRMKRVEALEDETFVPREETGKMRQNALNDTGQAESYLTPLKLVIDKSEASRVYDRFEEEEITVLENGDFLISLRCLVDEWVYGMILSFGPSAKVLEPVEVKDEILRRIELIREKYKE